MSNIIVALALVLLPGVLQEPAPSQDPGARAPQSIEKSAPKSDTAAPADTLTHPATGMSTCYFYRPRLSRGSAVRIGIYVDGAMAVNMVNGRWASIQLPAGHHIIKPKDDQSGIEIDMEPGQSYYIRSGWGEEGFFHGAHKNIMLMMKEQANYEIRQLKPLDEKDVTWSKANSPTAK